MSRSMILSIALLTIFSVSCTKKQPTPEIQSSAQATAAASKEVNLSIWGNYITPEMTEKFTAETGVKINISNYSSNEELLAKLQSGAAGVDVAVPSDYMVDIMVKSGLLEPLKAEMIPNIAGLDSQWINQSFDPGNKFSVPYAWSTAGIAYNTELVKTPISSWKDVVENQKLKGKISLMDDVREVTGAALKINGFSVNTTSKAELDKAKATLLSLKPKVKMFRSDTIDALANKEVAVAHTYSTDALQAAAKSNGKIKYVIPAEGGTRAIDNLVIIKGAKNSENAHKLINFLISKEANLAFVKTIYGGPVVKATIESLPEEIRKNTALFPSADMMGKLEKIQDLGDETKTYDDLWTQVKTN